MRVQCPHCKAVCQVDPLILGGQLKCGKCTRLFTAIRQPLPPGAGSVPSSATTTAPEVECSAEASSAKTPSTSPARARLSSLWSGVQNIYQKIATPRTPAGAIPSATDSSAADDGDMGLDLDSPDSGIETPETQPDEPTLGADPPALHGEFRLDVAGCSSVGRVRTRNEDSFLTMQYTWSSLDRRHDVALVIVADGMGGYDAGDRASRLTILQSAASLGPVLANFLKLDASANRPSSFRAPVQAALKSANAAVYQQAQTEPGCKGMGATVAAVLVWDGRVDIGHIGDCRVYHFRHGTLTQVTRDQTLVERMIELGQLTRAEAESHPARNEVTAAVGRHPDIDPAYCECTLLPGDWLVVSCDGLHAHVNQPALIEALHAAPSSAALLANYLVALANHQGGSDNCTVVAVRCY